VKASLFNLQIMKRYLFCFFCVSMLGFLQSGCSKQSAVISFPELTSYYPLEIGHVLVYRLDSSVIPFTGSELEVRSYHAKDSIADTIRDNQQRLSYRVYRFVSDTLEKDPWRPIATYYVTPSQQTVELVDENNLRFIKLKQPLRNDFTWNGNSYIDTRSASSVYQYLDGWNYIYQHVGEPYTVLKGTLENTITILQQDETSPPGPFDPSNYQQRNYSVEVYAKDIGLVYKEFTHWTWQTTPPPAKFDNDSYGITLSLINYH
jgi:hypothetical protein